MQMQQMQQCMQMKQNRTDWNRIRSDKNDFKVATDNVNPLVPEAHYSEHRENGYFYKY